MPFALAFGVESMEYLELMLVTPRAKEMDWKENDFNLRSKFDLLEEKRELAARRVKANQRRIVTHYNNMVKAMRLSKGDYMLRKVTMNTMKPK